MTLTKASIKKVQHPILLTFVSVVALKPPTSMSRGNRQAANGFPSRSLKRNLPQASIQLSPQCHRRALDNQTQYNVVQIPGRAPSQPSPTRKKCRISARSLPHRSPDHRHTKHFARRVEKPIRAAAVDAGEQLYLSSLASRQVQCPFR